MARLIGNIRESGADRKAMREAIGFVDRALRHLEAMPRGPEREALEGLARYIVDRSF